MVGYRITTAKWAGRLTASGYPARWNSKGTHIIYAASSRALACLENLVHRSGEGLNHLFKITEIYFPVNVSTEQIKQKDLSDGWYKVDNYHRCQKIGDQWIERKSSLFLQVPSSIIRDEFNMLINPNHSEFSQVEIQKISSFTFDERL